MSSLDINQYEFSEISVKDNYKSIIESLLFVSGEPLTLRELSNNLELEDKYIKELLGEMMEEYDQRSRGIKIIPINGSYQLVTKPINSDHIQKLIKKHTRQSLSQASLESLAIIAYKQPITRIEIEDIRGVKSDSAIQRLIERDLICEVGRKEVPGRPILYGTTDEFLRHFGLVDLKQLPSLDLYADEEDVQELKKLEEITKMKEVSMDLS